jgi:hypothetical protein
MTTIPAIANYIKGDITVNVKKGKTVKETLELMGYAPYVNKMNNVVCKTPLEEAPHVLITMHDVHGIKGSLTVTWEGTAKCYFSPDPACYDKAIESAYNKEHKLPAPKQLMLA